MTRDEANERDDGGDASTDAALAPIAPLLRDEATWVEPPADLFERIVADTRTTSTTPVATVTPLAPRRRSLAAVVAAIAAASAIMFGAGFLVGIARDDDPPASAEDELVAQLALVGTEAAPTAHAVVDVFDRGAGYAFILRTEGLDPAPDGEYYEGWLSSTVGGDVSIGTFHMRGGDGTVVLWSGVDVADYPLLFVTRRAAGSLADDPVVMTGEFVPG